MARSPVIETEPLPVLEVDRAGFPAGFEGKWHSAAKAQLIYPGRGVMILHTQEGTWTVPPLQGCWLTADEMHRVQTSKGFEMLSVYCRGSLLNKLPSKTGLVSVTPLLREIIFALEKQDTGKRRHWLEFLFTDEVKLTGPPPLFLPPMISDRLQMIEETLRNDPANSRTLGDWALHLGSTTRTLARAFQREAKMSFTAYRRQARLHAAIRELAEGRRVTATALKLGFGSTSAFIVAFRRATGVTPSRYFTPK